MSRIEEWKPVIGAMLLLCMVVGLYFGILWLAYVAMIGLVVPVIFNI